MKRFLVTAAILLALSGFMHAAENIVYVPYELDSLIHSIDNPGAPVITDDYIIFTAEAKHNFVGIAFDFENYQVIHPFKLLTSMDMDGKKSPRHLFYCYERQHKYTSIKYRLIIDGLWTTDPLNPSRVYDENVDLFFSKVSDLGILDRFTEQTKRDTVHFIYKGAKGLKLNLAGTFTNWDPWIYEMQETSPGFYELDLPLPSGKYYYNYYNGLTPLLDNTNPDKVYTMDGRTASVIVVK
ncbi:MAG: isoamylase [Treponema sp.]|nr:isoamylase [Treponema sp.]